MLKLELAIVSATERQHEGTIAGLACIGNQVFTAGQDKRILSFQLPKQRSLPVSFMGLELRNAEKFVDLQAVPRMGSDFTLVASCNDSDVRIWNSGARKEAPSTLSGHVAAVTGVDAMDNFVLSSSWDQTARVWDLHHEAEIVALPHPAGVHRALFCPLSRTIMTSCANGTLGCWDLRVSNDSPTCSMGGSTSEFSQALATAPGDLVAWPISDSEVEIFDVPRCGSRSITSLQLSSPARSLQFLPQARVLSCGDANSKLLTMKLEDLSIQQFDLQPGKSDRQAVTRLRCVPEDGSEMLTFLFSKHGWGYARLT
mmetsp:Transcript_14209/g.24966  ORF Transcript_14209/g.24966 Transcript_14209/m.24966 type:complete len:313 (+) Transcript_14209:38-976(+)